MLKHCATNRKRRFSALPNVSPFIYDVKISGLQGVSYICDISRLRVKGDYFVPKTLFVLITEMSEFFILKIVISGCLRNKRKPNIGFVK
jgi:hypothetical protein